MKKILNILLILSAVFALVSCEIFEIDNYEAPNASFHGSIKDAQTGELVETDIQNGSAIRAYELGWPTEAAQTWVVKQNGEFRNDLVFAAHYKIEFINGNFFPFTIADLEIKKGDNAHDFEVTPYIRVRNVNIRKEGNSILATFSLQAGKPEVKLSAVRLYAFTDIYVGEQVKFDTTGSACTPWRPRCTTSTPAAYTSASCRLCTGARPSCSPLITVICTAASAAA
jgi:hypothetical protein